MYPAGPEVRGVPTLVLGGEYDLPVPEAVSRQATDVLVGATYVSMTAAGHDPQFWSDCGPELVQRFILDRRRRRHVVRRRTGRRLVDSGQLPERASIRHRRPCRPRARGHRDQRRLVTVAAWTVMDSVQHNFFVPGDSVALRGGTVDFEPIDERAAVDARPGPLHPGRRRERRRHRVRPDPRR